MPSYASPHASRNGDVAATLKLLAWLALAIALIALDHRGGWLAQLRQRADAMVQPLWWLAGVPARIGDTLSETAATRNRLAEGTRLAVVADGPATSRPLKVTGVADYVDLFSTLDVALTNFAD